MAKFKVGDKVVRREEFIDYSFPSTEEIHEVTESYDEHISVKKYPGMSLYWLDNRFKLYEEPVMANETKKPHVHAECIKAWADGATIEFRCGGEYEWRELKTTCPSWSEGFQYRIKPEPKPDVVKEVGAVLTDQNISGVGVSLYNPLNLKLTFDGETGKLKDAKVIS